MRHPDGWSPILEYQRERPSGCNYVLIMLNGDHSASRIVTRGNDVVPSGLLDELPDWRRAMQSAIRDARQLCRRLELPEAVAHDAAAATGDFPVFVPLELLRRIRPADPLDPVLLQVLPRSAERYAPPDFSRDAVGDGPARVVAGSGLLKKYDGRALWITTGICPVHCRYCFRRHFEYQPNQADPEVWNEVCAWLAADPTIEELILSGGDPLTWSDDHLEALIENLQQRVPHLSRLRVHSRMPIMIPQRVTLRLVELLRGSRLAVVMVIHANHPQEIDTYVQQAIKRLVGGGIPTLNQSVLLRGVNDTRQALEGLSRSLIQIGVMPYYLHQLDRVLGAAHFEVDPRHGKALIQELRSRLPGYAVPRYVREVAGESAKVPVE